MICEVCKTKNAVIYTYIKMKKKHVCIECDIQCQLVAESKWSKYTQRVRSSKRN